MVRTVTSRRMAAGLAGGVIAIVANTMVLKAADFVPVATAKGGLLRLIRPWFEPLLGKAGVTHLWSAVGGPSPEAPMFQIGFHLTVGLLMALVYALALEPALPGRAWMKGALYAIGMWILNAAVVLPATGEGFAGAAHLTLTGMVWFAGAHSLFFLLLALLFERFDTGGLCRRLLVQQHGPAL
jgi:hypothetical protein